MKWEEGRKVSFMQLMLMLSWGRRNFTFNAYLTEARLNGRKERKITHKKRRENNTKRKKEKKGRKVRKKEGKTMHMMKHNICIKVKGKWREKKNHLRLLRMKIVIISVMFIMYFSLFLCERSYDYVTGVSRMYFISLWG